MKLSKSYLHQGLLIGVIVFSVGTAMAMGPPPQSAPEVGSTSLLLGLSVMGLAALKRFIKR